MPVLYYEISKTPLLCYPLRMAEQKRIIDLRSKEAVGYSRESVPLQPRERRAQALQAPTTDRRRDERSAVLLSWSAPEYEHRARHPHWWLWPGGGALAFVLLGILIHSYFFVAFVVLAFIVVLMYGRRAPRTMDFSVTREGMMVGRGLHRFTDIKSFWIFDAAEPYELSLEIDRITAPYLRLPLGELHPNKIRAVLSDFLPEEQHKEFMSDHFARALGF